jgi:hypothetical protein
MEPKLIRELVQREIVFEELVAGHAPQGITLVLGERERALVL